MNIHQVSIKNIRSLRSTTWKVDRQNLAGWHVILGDNGSGKSTFLRAIALALTGPKEASGLRQLWANWITHDMPEGSVELRALPGPQKNESKRTRSTFGVRLKRSQDSFAEAYPVEHDSRGDNWTNSDEWFSASYGPFRRFGRPEYGTHNLRYGSLVGRHLSIFDDSFGLAGSIEWLQGLKFRRLEDDPDGQLLPLIINFVNSSDFLPNGVRIDKVTSREITFRDSSETVVDVTELSDGYRSVLSMTFDLIRQMAECFGPQKVFDVADQTKIAVSGVVIIDEIDAHLHPLWQQSVGFWFCRHFPNIQFLVSTHSPLVCQAAETGSVFLLPKAGSRDDAKMLDSRDFNRVVFGNVLDAYGTAAFGREVAATRSHHSRELHRQLAELNNKELTDGLTPDELIRQLHLRDILPTVANDLE